MREAGTDLNRDIAARVFGLDVSGLVRMPIPCPDGRGGCQVLHTALFFPTGVALPDYSGDMNAAMEVAEAMRGKKMRVTLASGSKGAWIVLFCPGYTGEVEHEQASAETPALAICRAALLALDGLEEKARCSKEPS